jgi:predicted transcriptional regulator of viral defense system
MTKTGQKLYDYFNKKGGIVRFSAILKAGFHSDSLSSLEKEGKVERIGRGLYRAVNRTLGSHPDLVAASYQAPKGVICLISALYFHEVTVEIPRYVDMAIPSNATAHKIKYPPVKFYKFSMSTWKAGIEEHDIDGHKIHVYSLAKTIADCFKFRNKIGVDVAREALKAALSEKKIKPKDILFYATICRVDNIIKPILEVLL